MKEIKRRIQVLKLSNQDKLLNRIGIKSVIKGKFEIDDKEEQFNDKKDYSHVDYMLKMQEILEISNVYIYVLDFYLGETGLN